MALFFYVAHFQPFCLLPDNFQPDFQIALKEPVKKKSVENSTLGSDLIWYILMALRPNSFVAVYINTLYTVHIKLLSATLLLK